MSKIGKKTIFLPKESSIKIDGANLTITGPKGSKTLTINDKIFSSKLVESEFQLKPLEKKVSDKSNPPELIIEFFKDQKNINNINCYSNDGGVWKKANLKFEGQSLIINFDQKFLPRRGRINCSLNDNGKWRWFGTQFTVE